MIKEELMPHWLKNGKYKFELDQFYTPLDTAKYCVELCKKYINNFEEYTILEPSAGNGSFLHFLPTNTIAIDIQPKNKNIKKMDFFDFLPNQNIKYVCIGNPPFGIRGWYALEFINKALTFCDYVCFILPKYFASDGKGGCKYRVKNGELIFNTELKDNEFIAENKKININVVFQIWKRGITQKYQEPKMDMVEIYTCCTNEKRKCGLDKLNEYDCFVSSTYYGKLKGINFVFEQVKYGSGYGLIIKNKKKEIIDFLSNIDWDNYSFQATNKCKHITKQNIKKALLDGGFN